MLSFFPFACASSGAKREAAEVRAERTAHDAEDARVAALKDGIHVQCVVTIVGEGLGNPDACEGFDFALEDEQGLEIARLNPDSRGQIDFKVPAEKAFKVNPKVSGAWTIEWDPPTSLHRGDTVRIILRK